MTSRKQVQTEKHLFHPVGQNLYMHAGNYDNVHIIKIRSFSDTYTRAFSESPSAFTVKIDWPEINIKLKEKIYR